MCHDDEEQYYGTVQLIITAVYALDYKYIYYIIYRTKISQGRGFSSGQRLCCYSCPFGSRCMKAAVDSDPKPTPYKIDSMHESLSVLHENEHRKSQCH